MSLIPVIKGGLGNQLFQVATVWAIAKATRRPFKINKEYISHNPHSPIDYFETIMAYWKPYFTDHTESRIIRENPSFHPQDLIKMIGTNKNQGAILDGYFQTTKYIDPYYNELISHFSWNKSVIAKYEELSTSAFIHVRGGDYLRKGGSAEFHHIDMTHYYKRALEKMKGSVNNFYVFTNDIPYLESHQIFDDIRYAVIPNTVSEIDSLYLMSQCKRGGIGVNSSFSWWGLYLDKNREFLTLPDRWFVPSHMYTEEYYIPEFQKLPTAI